MTGPRVALLADLHGESVALDAVLAELAEARPDVVMCLGDIAFGPDPVGVVDRIAGRDWVVVQGNADADLADPPAWWSDPAAAGVPESAWRVPDIGRWCADRLGGDRLGYLAGLPATADVPSAGVFGFHGSPRSANDVITATTADDEVAAMLGGIVPGRIYAGGHTHVPLLRRIGEATLLNPGSVGLPFARYGLGGQVPVLDHAAWAIVDDGRIEFRRTPVDRDRAAASVRTSGMPHTDWWLGQRRK